MEEVEIVSAKESISVNKENGTDVKYYLFDEYEVHDNVIKAHTIQQWHYHTNIEETIFVIEGHLGFSWIEDEKKKTRTLQKGDLVRVKHSIHTFYNESDKDCHFIVFRFVPTNLNKREIIKNDKCIVDIK